MRRLAKRFMITFAGVMALYLILRGLRPGKIIKVRKLEFWPPECHYTRLRREIVTEETEDHSECLIHKPSVNACREANKYFGSPFEDLVTRNCTPLPTPDICWFTDTQPPKLQCSESFCGDYIVYMARLDPRHGTVNHWQAISPFTTENAQKFVNKIQAEGGTFCLIKCGEFTQVILFPPKLILTENLDRKPNVVILLLDSLSRRHFYRVLRKSVQALRDVMNDPSGAATVLDFELFQSISMHTFDNLRPLFSGVLQGYTDFKKKSSASQRPVGIDILFKHFKQHDYQTMIQEDLCWYDEWGTLLDNMERKSDSTPSVQRWVRFNELIRNHQLDHLGITHFTCEVLKYYSLSNLYDRPSKVCFNGRFISSYFYKYTRSFVNAIRRTKNAKPIILYQHLNTAHTETGTRITNMDQDLASFIHFMSKDPNTWTLILSDHGHTRTPYGQTEEGLLERYNPLLFMIIPKQLAKRLGRETMDNLSTNQRRILTTLDLHKALMTFHQESNSRSKDFRKTGVFSKIPSSRTCFDLPLMPLARCQCEGAEQSLRDNSPSHTWLAEFALGTLNGYIQHQYSNGKHSKSLGVKGYGRCVRLTGKSFTKVIQRQHGSVVKFNIHVDATVVGLQDDEVFQVAVRLNNGVPKLVLYDRQTLYNKFKPCADESVDIKLCMCDKRKPLNDVVSRIDSKKVAHPKLHFMFQSHAEITNLYENCLLQVIRRHPSGISVAYEVINSCNDKTFEVLVEGTTEYVFLSMNLPMAFTIQPNTHSFMFSGTRQILSHSHLDIKVIVRLVR